MKRAITLLAASLLAFGLVVGGLVGMSHSPVVGAVLPLLFGLLGGAGGFFVLRGDFSKRGPANAISVYALALACISIGTGLGVFWGVRYRTEPWSLVGESNARAFPPIGAVNAEVIEWLLLDARLAHLGLSKTQRMLLFDRIPGAQGSQDLQLSVRTRQILSRFAEAMPAEDHLVPGYEWHLFMHRATELDDIANAAPAHSIPPDFAMIFEALSKNLLELTDDPEDAAYLASTPSVIEPLRDIRRLISAIGLDLRAHADPLYEIRALFASDGGPSAAPPSKASRGPASSGKP